jgi:hypothetical protein
VLAQPGEDCSRGPDAVPGNARCDLAPARTAGLSVETAAKVTLQGGAYTFCEVAVSQTAEVIADATTTIDVHGDVRINNDASFGPPPGQDCGRITVRANGPGAVTFGRQVKVNGFFCAPERTRPLGHDNDLTGASSATRSTPTTTTACSAARATTSRRPARARSRRADEPLRRDVDSYFVLASGASA